MFRGTGERASARFARKPLISNERGIADDCIDGLKPLRTGRKEVGRQQIRWSDSIFVQLLADAPVNRGVQFDAEHLCRWVATDLA